MHIGLRGLGSHWFSSAFLVIHSARLGIVHSILGDLDLGHNRSISSVTSLQQTAVLALISTSLPCTIHLADQQPWRSRHHHTTHDTHTQTHGTRLTRHAPRDDDVPSPSHPVPFPPQRRLTPPPSSLARLQATVRVQTLLLQAGQAQAGKLPYFNSKWHDNTWYPYPAPSKTKCLIQVPRPDTAEVRDERRHRLVGAAPHTQTMCLSESLRIRP